MADKTAADVMDNAVNTAGEVANNAIDKAGEVAKAASPKIQELANKMLGYLEQGVDMAAEQAPLLAQEVIWWGIASNGMYLILEVVLLVVGITIARKTYHPWTDEVEKNYRDPSFDGGVMMINGIGFLASTAISVICFFRIVFWESIGTLKPIVAPRIYLIEYFTALANGKPVG